MLLYANPSIRVPTDLKSPEIMKMLGFGPSHQQIEKPSVQNGAEYFYGAFGDIFSINSPYKLPKHAKTSPKYVCPIFALFFGL